MRKRKPELPESQAISHPNRFFERAPICKERVEMRLSGLAEDVEAIAKALRESGVVLEESRNYANRGSSLVR